MKLRILVMALLALLAACGSDGAGGPQGEAGPAPTMDAATRAQHVVAGRPARVFVFAGVGKNCEPIPEPEITIDAPPAKGDISLQKGQDTTIMSSAKGTCIGAKARGTGVYYTARAGSSGADRFSVTAALAGGERSTRHFEVMVAE